MRFLITAIVLTRFATIPGAAQLAPPERPAVEAYRAAIRLAESRPASARAVEAVFSAVDSLRDALIRGADGKPELESLSDEDFKHLEPSLPGIAVSREEVVYVEADIAWFARLAAAHGDEADQAFFATLQTTYGGAITIFPVYIDRQTDYSGCTRFGSMSLVDTYRAWSEFRARFPNRYTAAVKKEVEEVTNELTGSTCACGNMASVEQELELFLRNLPGSPDRSKVDERLRTLRARPAEMRSNCVSG